jgi:hypothetical protein
VWVIDKNEMGGTCSKYGGGERCARGVGGETEGKSNWGDTDIDEIIN